jgi:hypothetical protein
VDRPGSDAKGVPSRVIDQLESSRPTLARRLGRYTRAHGGHRGRLDAKRVSDRRDRPGERQADAGRRLKGAGSRAAALAMVFELVESAQARWRAVNAPHLVALVRAGARFERGELLERPETFAA